MSSDQITLDPVDAGFLYRALLQAGKTAMSPDIVYLARLAREANDAALQGVGRVTVTITNTAATVPAPAELGMDGRAQARERWRRVVAAETAVVRERARVLIDSESPGERAERAAAAIAKYGGAA